MYPPEALDQLLVLDRERVAWPGDVDGAADQVAGADTVLGDVGELDRVEVGLARVLGQARGPVVSGSAAQCEALAGACSGRGRTGRSRRNLAEAAFFRRLLERRGGRRARFVVEVACRNDEFGWVKWNVTVCGSTTVRRFEAQDVATHRRRCRWSGLGQVRPARRRCRRPPGRRAVAVGERDAVTESERVVESVGADLPVAGEPRHDLAGRPGPGRSVSRRSCGSPSGVRSSRSGTGQRN